MTSVWRDDMGHLGPLTFAAGSGEEHVGSFSGHSVVGYVEVERPANTDAYTPGDVWALVPDGDDDEQPNLIAGMGRIVGGRGVITDVGLVCNANNNTKPQLELHFFKEPPTLPADSGALAMTAADLLDNWLGYIPVATSDWIVTNAGSAGAGNLVASLKNINLMYQCGVAATSLCVLIVVRNAYTPISEETLAISVKALQE